RSGCMAEPFGQQTQRRYQHTENRIECNRFLYKQFLKQELGEIQFINANRGRQLPTVFTHDEAMRVLSFMSGDHRLAASLMYGAGLRVMEAVRLRVRSEERRGGKEGR